MNNKIRIVSCCLKWSVVGLSLLTLGYLLIAYLVQGTFNFNSDSPLFIDLWQHQQANKGLLMLMSLPALILWTLIVFWSYRLFSYFELEEYFSDRSVRCYIWLVWIQVALFAQNIIVEFGLGYYHAHFFEDTAMSISLDLSRFFSLLLMISIVHILKVARQVELENKEFV
ncbi:MAG: hypothetical protein MK214_16955 [Thalassotalea sp.]|nr:hypothetical protein [Thalassotalea sp.]